MNNFIQNSDGTHGGVDFEHVARQVCNEDGPAACAELSIEDQLIEQGDDVFSNGQSDTAGGDQASRQQPA